MNFICPLCKSEFSTPKSISNHLTRKHKNLSELEREKLRVYIIFSESLVEQTVKDYIDEKFCTYNLPIDISKYLTLLKIKRTSKEERQTTRYKENYIKAIQLKFNDETITNVSQLNEVKLKKQKKFTERLDIQLELLNDGFKKYVHTEKHYETIDKIESTCLERYGHKNFGCGEEARKKNKITRAKTISTWDYEERLERTLKARQQVKFSSKIEKKVQKCLVDLDINFKSNTFKWKYNWDIIFDKFIIEVQGIFWHAKPTLYKENDLIVGDLLAKDIWKKDKRKKEIAESNGFIVIELWEDEINQQADNLTQFIKEVLLENGYKF